jgi:hypothetical protein
MSLLRALCWFSVAGVSITDPLEPPVLELGGPAIPAGYLLKCPRRWRSLSGDWISASAGGNPVDRVAARLHWDGQHPTGQLKPKNASGRRGSLAPRRTWRTFQHDDDCPSSLEFQRLKPASRCNGADRCLVFTAGSAR